MLADARALAEISAAGSELKRTYRNRHLPGWRFFHLKVHLLLRRRIVHRRRQQPSDRRRTDGRGAGFAQNTPSLPFHDNARDRGEGDSRNAEKTESWWWRSQSWGKKEKRPEKSAATLLYFALITPKKPDATATGSRSTLTTSTPSSAGSRRYLESKQNSLAAISISLL